ncbi:MAG: BadF/BadG/BcrA/BcrD ATPase family protein, partial [Actinocatenispora sp.]
MSLVLGLDMGGTATRALLADTTGARLGSGRGGPGNPFAHPPERVAATMTDTIRQALREVEPGDVRSGLVGMAGGARLAEPAVATMFEHAWRSTGLRCPMRVVGDTDVAYAAGTAEPDGAVLIAGTGAVAATVVGHRAV